MAAPAASPVSAPDRPAAPAARANFGFRHYRRFLAQLRFGGRCGCGLIALWLAVVLRGWLPGAIRPMTSATVVACLAILASAVAAGGVTRRFGRALRSPSDPALVAFSTIAVLIALFFDRSLGLAVSRPTILLFAVLSAGALGGWDLASRFWLPRAAQVRNLVWVGDWDEAAGQELGQNRAASPWQVAARFEVAALASLGAAAVLERLHSLIRREPIDEILVSSAVWEAGTEGRELFRGISELCEQTGVRLHVHAQWLSGFRQVHVDYLGERPIVTFSFSVASPWLLALKRAADLGLSALLLLCLSPLLLAAGLAVKLDSPGPALFSQVRCGLRGRAFRIYKFRSMVADAEARRASLQDANEMSGPVFKLARDPRVTRLGHWLRKASLDELPQLWNVLRGEMSLVGPRPPLPEEVREYHLDSLHRLAMKPGMTGLWQVSGRSSIQDFSQWLALDARYIREWSPWLDCKVLFRTLGVLMRMDGQ